VKKHILMVTSTLPRWQADPEPRFVLDLAKAIQGTYEVTVLAPAAPGAALEEVLEGVRVRRYRYAPLRRWELLAYPGAIMPRLRKHAAVWLLVPLLLLGLRRALRKMVKKEQIDCVHAHWFLPQGLIQAYGFLGKRAPPFIVTSHGGDLTSLSGRLLERLIEGIVTHASAVTAVSPPLSEVLRGLRSRQDRLFTIPMGVDCQRFNPECRDEHFYDDLPGEGAVVLFVGRLAEKKGVTYLLQAMATLPLSDCAVRLLIVGDGPEKSMLQAQAEQLGLSQQVIFHSPVGHSELPVLMASTDMLCAPSVVARDGDTDGMPTVILEGTACGLPCVTTPVGGIGGYIRSGENGRLVPPGDKQALSAALADLLRDPAERRRLGEAARASALTHDWQKVGARFTAVYREVIDG
jgi:glycosyltransferase involved in cell wall biosynthesis